MSVSFNAFADMLVHHVHLLGDRGYHAPIILIDGRSGAGKTTLAGRLGTELDWQLVHLDDFYPGWDGLEAGADIVANEVLDIANPGYESWDWQADDVGSYRALISHKPMIIEGCGAISRGSLDAARRWAGDAHGVVSVFLTAEEQWRYNRATARDPGFAPYWQMWARQERHHLRRWAKQGIECGRDCDFVYQVDAAKLTSSSSELG